MKKILVAILGAGAGFAVASWVVSDHLTTQHAGQLARQQAAWQAERVNLESALEEAKALKHLEGYVQEDGGIYNPKGGVPNYETALTVICFKEANKDGRYDRTLKAAERWLKKHQWNEGDKAADGKPIDKSSPNFGGAGYGKKARPDLSNTQMFLDALQNAECEPPKASCSA